MKPEINIEARYEEKIRIGGLGMIPEIAGAMHKFKFENQTVTVRLPPMPTATGPQFDRDLDAEVYSWNSGSGKPTRVAINLITVIVSEIDCVIPEEAANYPAENAALYDDEQRDRLDFQSDKFCLLARRAIDYWLRIV